MSDRKAAAFERLLQDEREMILTGRFDAIADISARKAEALGELPDWDLPAARLGALARQVTRNQGLLDAAIRGMKAAQLRVESVLGSAGTLSTYNSYGQVSDLGQTRQTLQKKA